MISTRTRAVAVVALLLLLATTQQASSPWHVSLRSFGPIRFGMTLAQLERALGERLALAPAEEECEYIRPRALPPGTMLMLVGRRVEHVDVDSGTVTTLSGIGIGSTEAEVHQAYPGQIRSQPHPYNGPEWHYVLFQPRDSVDRRFGLIFETDGTRVRSFRAGRYQPVGWIEGCS